MSLDFKSRPATATATTVVRRRTKSTSKSANTPIPLPLKFVFGGVAGMGATMFIQPLDLIKTRLQITQGKYTGVFHAFKTISRTEGMLAVYDGLSAALLRQATYATARLGVYTYLLESLSSGNKQPGYATKVGIAFAAGAAGAFVGTPAEVALVRMTADGRLPIDQRRGYTNAFNALFRIVREEGLFTLWRGCGPTVGRAMVVNAAQLATYSQAKQLLLSKKLVGDNIGCHALASTISGVVTATASLPVDMAKTRVQNMKVVDGVPEYRGAIDVLTKVVRSEGVLALWKGFVPYCPRIAMHTILTFVFLEQLNNGYKALATSRKWYEKPAGFAL